MITLTKEWLLKTIAELEEERDATPGIVNEDAAMALEAMKLALASIEAKDNIPELRQVIYHFRDWNEGFPVERFKADYVISWMLANYPPAQPTAVSVPDAMDGQGGVCCEVSYADGWNACRAAMLQGAEQTNYRAIVERIAEIVHGKVTDIDLLTVTVKSIKDNLQGKASLRDEIRSEHAEWSQYTFGDVGPVGPLKHLSKEALEAAEEPEDPSEWADMQFLLWDAQRRAGITDEKIAQALIDKLAVNKARQWPEPKDGEPRLHIKAGLKLEGQEKQKK